MKLTGEQKIPFEFEGIDLKYFFTKGKCVFDGHFEHFRVRSPRWKRHLDVSNTR